MVPYIQPLRGKQGQQKQLILFWDVFVLGTGFLSVYGFQNLIPLLFHKKQSPKETEQGMHSEAIQQLINFKGKNVRKGHCKIFPVW